MTRSQGVVLVVWVSAVAALAVLPASSAWAVPAEEAIVKAKALAAAYTAQLVRLYEGIYHCMPWVELPRRGIGFRAPRGSERDDRYLSAWIIIDQSDDGTFAAMPRERRVSAMFSRYGVDLMRRLASLQGIAEDPRVAGFAVVLSWLKPGPVPAGAQPTNETVAVFVDKATALEYLHGRLAAAALGPRLEPLLFDGKEELGRIPLTVWESRFVATFKLRDHQPASGQKC